MKAFTQYIVHQKCGKEAFEKDKWQDYGFMDGYLSLSIYADDGFLEDSIRTGMYQNIKALVPAIFKDRPEVKKLEINILYPMTDAKGQDFDGVAMFAYFTRENNDTINWDNIKLKNISIIADGFLFILCSRKRKNRIGSSKTRQITVWLFFCLASFDNSLSIVYIDNN